MKWYWWAIIALVVVVLIYGIYAWTQSAAAERELERQRVLAAAGGDKGVKGKANIWTVIDGLSDLFGKTKWGDKKKEEEENDDEEDAAGGPIV